MVEFRQIIGSDYEFQLSRSCKVKGHGVNLQITYGFIYADNTNHGDILNILAVISKFRHFRASDLEFKPLRSRQVKGHSVNLQIIYEFIYVDNTNHGPILNSFGDISHFRFSNFDLQRSEVMTDLIQKQQVPSHDHKQ